MNFLKLLIILVLCIVFFGGCYHQSKAQQKEIAEFARLYSTWHQEAEAIRFSSNTDDYIGLPSYLKMIAIGKPALPYLEQKMAEGKGIDFMLAFAAVDICGLDIKLIDGESVQEFCDRVLRKLNKK